MTRKYLASALLALALPFSAAHAATTLNAGGSSLAAPTYIAEFKAFTASYPTVLFDYAAVGSGGGQKAFLNNDITQFEAPNVTSSTLTYGTIVGSQVDFGASDAPLSASQLTNAATGSYGTSTEGSAVDGPLIQIPTFGVPITLAYNESAATKTLALNDKQICGILSGKITDWHNISASVPAGTTIKVVYFSNSSGTTYLITQHLHAVCTSANSNFPVLPVPITKYFQSSTSSNNPVFATVPANFTGENATSAAAAQLVATPNSFGYLSPDFTSIAPLSANTTALKVANVINAINGDSYAPTVANTETGLAHPGPGSTNATPPATLAAAMDPLNWVPTMPETTSGYPIVGYSTVELSTCYAAAKAASNLKLFLTDEYNVAAYRKIIQNNGFSPLANTAAAPYINSVVADFLTNTSGFNLNINNATACTGYAGR